MKKILLITALLGGAFNAQADRPSVHGMLLFGKENLYASHLPMFHAPHDYQVIFKLNLSSNTGTVVKLK